MKWIDRLFWGSAAFVAIVALLSEVRVTGLGTPAQGPLFLVAGALALVPILARVLKANATWGTLAFFVIVGVFAYILTH